MVIGRVGVETQPSLGLTLVILTSVLEGFFTVDESKVLCRAFALVGSNRKSG
jgi:hypothetical protein